LGAFAAHSVLALTENVTRGKREELGRVLIKTTAASRDMLY
jgi:hypothetical protein